MASSSRTSRALPAVAVWTALTKAGSASRPARVAMAVSLSGAGASVVAAAAIVSRIVRSSPGSGGRTAISTTIGSSSSAPREVGEEAQARLVGPLGVVDGQQQRLLGGEVGGQPVQAVQGGEAVAVDLESGDEVGSRRALEELPDDAEAELMLQLGARRRQHPQAGRERARVAQQRGLAQACGPLDDHDRAAAVVARGRDRRGQSLHLALAFEQRHVSRRRRPRRPAATAARTPPARRPRTG